jgi:hypothetical protein
MKINATHLVPPLSWSYKQTPVMDRILDKNFDKNNLKIKELITLKRALIDEYDSIDIIFFNSTTMNYYKCLTKLSII